MLSSTTNPADGTDDTHRNLMVNYVPDAWTTNELQALFQQYGPLEHSNVVTDKATGLSKGYGFVRFANRVDAETAIQALHGFQIEGRTLAVKKAALGKAGQAGIGTPTSTTGSLVGGLGGASAVSNSIYVAGFTPGTMDEAFLKQLFEAYGPVTRVKLHSPQPGKKGVAFITYNTGVEAEQAAQKANGLALSTGDTLTVKIYSKDAGVSAASSMAVFGAPLVGAGLPLAAGGVISQAVAAGQASIYISGFTPSLVGEAQIKQLFEAFGKITRVRLHPSQPGKKGVAFVTYETLAEAENAVRNANGALLTTGDTITVKIDNRTVQDSQLIGMSMISPLLAQTGAAAAAAGVVGPVSVYVAGFTPGSITESDLQRLFSIYGPVQNVRMHTPQPGKKGVAFIDYASLHEAESAASLANGTVIPSTGDTITVKVENKIGKSKVGFAQPTATTGVTAMMAGIPAVGATALAGAGGAMKYHPYVRQGAVPTLSPTGGPVRVLTRPSSITTASVIPTELPPPNGSDGNYCVFVYGIDSQTILQQVAMAYGTVSNIRMQPGKKFGFISMPNGQQAMALIAALNGAMIPGICTTPIQARLAADRKDGTIPTDPILGQ